MPSPPNPGLQKTRPAILWGLGLIAILLAIAGIAACYFAFQPGIVLADRALLIAAALILLFLPLRVCFVALRRKRTTGQWTITTAEQEKLRQKSTNTRSLRYIDPVLLVVWIAGAAAWTYGNILHHRNSAWDWLVPAVYLFLAANSARSLYRKRQLPQPTTTK